MLSKQKMINSGAILLVSKGHTLVELTGTRLLHFYQKTWLHKLRKFHKNLQEGVYSLWLQVNASSLIFYSHAKTPKFGR